MELPRLEPLYQKYKDQGFQVIAIDGVVQLEEGHAFIEEHGLTYPIVRKGDENDSFVVDTFGVTVYPSSFMVDKDGKVRYFHLGFSPGDEEKVEKELKTLLNE